MEKEEKGEKKRQRAVPKFGSFKPKPTVESGPDTRATSEEAGARREDDRAGGERRSEGRKEHGRRHHERGREHPHSDRERDRHRERGKDGGREREGGKDSGRERERDKERERDRTRGRERERDHPAPLNDLFVIEKNGDPLILQFGSNDRSKVPAYYRFGGGRIIGSPGFLSIHRDGPQQQFTIRGPGEGSGSGSAFRDKALVAAASRATSKRVKPSADTALPAASDDFIPLGPPRKRKRDQDDPATTPDYRSIHGKARPDDPSDSDSSSPSRSPSPSPSHANPDQSTPKTRSIALSRHVKSNPADIPAWLELIALQDTLFSSHSTSNSSGSSKRTADETKSLAELKLSLYQEALPHAAGCPPGEREALVLGMMREGAKVWGEAVLVRKWDEVVQEEGGGGGFGLWRGRLDFEMGRRRVTAFGVEEVRGLVTGKLHSLGEALLLLQGVAGGKQEEELCGQVVYVFLRLTRFLQDAGFGELAVAAWQAVLEMTFCRPRDDYSAESARASFADFWESEVARIGEEGAKGWRQFVEAGDDMADPPEAVESKHSELPKTTDPFKAWAATEQQATEKARMPARTLDEGTEDDPFRVVMFSDIRDFLVWFPSDIIPRVKPLLADAFLVFCGLPPAALSGEKFATMLNDPFVAGKGQGLHLGLQRDEAGTTLDLSRRPPEFKQQGGSMAISPDVLFSGDSWFRYLDKWSNMHEPGDTQAEISWVLRTLGYLVKDCGMEAVAEYYLAMEWLNAPTGARKVAKGLLKQYSSNIRLYNAYALVEWANHNTEVSHKVLSSATGLALPSTSSSQLLWNTWAWIHLESGQKDMALARLCSSVETGGSAVSPVLILKARSHLSSTRDYSLSSQHLEAAAQHAESIMLLEYLAAEAGNEPTSETQGSITAALSTIQAFSRELESRKLSSSPHHERLLQTAARLLYHHATHGPYRPSYVRAQLETLLHLFPHNTIFLSLFAWCQPALRIDDPVRTILQTLSLSEPHNEYLSTHRFAIAHEARVGTAHSVRAAFEAALLEGSSVELWRAYVRFCAGERELRGKAREVFYRAIGACPWAKGVYMEAFCMVGGGLLGGDELRGVVETVAARGLRVHVDLEGFLEGGGGR
ncbi:NRDE-2, necessary for RNA interference-domain-containing protein [Chaetomidium leptoderma]|uniref:NRDE-2, necessary for RNA interference-domain-containing protein n=1 Tax=Chaetomidium leptoderma TaxID=669021 RepID=A0AAN6ZVQ8_9PEZI|nr:NRDE-2, necessary for RNA interference-domain-containing protein [Chaetomidium leptoderma]